MSLTGTLGRIAFGPRQTTDGRDIRDAFRGEPYPACDLLLELFDGDGGHSHGLYWAGRSNRIEAGPRGVETTYDPLKARRIPLALRDVAEALAEALNRIPIPNVDGVVNVWRAVEHDFL